MIFLKDTEDRKIYVTADLHLGHLQEFVWGTRGFKSAQDHEDEVINTINRLVRPNDILIVVGDFCLNSSIDKFNGYLDRIQCQNIWHFWGNHNNPHEKQVYRKMMRERGFADDEELYPLKYRNFVFKGYYQEMALNGNFTVFLHYPIAVFNEISRGAWMLCGHSHYGYPPSTAEHLDAKLLDVGWDGHGRPWTIPEIKEVMDKKAITKVDHH